MTYFRNFTRIVVLSTAAFASLTMAACQPATYQSQQDDRTAAIDSALARASDRGVVANSGESLAAMERAYSGNSDDPAVATKYAKALRDAGRLNRAAVVLTPFAQDSSLKSEAVKTEFASIQAAMGNYKEAENYARQAVLLNPDIGQPYHVLGTALDAQGYHDQAEVAFRRALEHWQGNPATVLNNLGLNLASQGFLDEAVDVLRKAQAADPQRPEIERNLRIVTTLQQNAGFHGNKKRAAIPLPEKKTSENDVKDAANDAAKIAPAASADAVDTSVHEVEKVAVKKVESTAKTERTP